MILRSRSLLERLLDARGRKGQLCHLVDPYRYGGGGAPATPEPAFANVLFGANFTGTNGQTSATDFSTSARTITFAGAAAITTSDSAFGDGSCLSLDGSSGCYIHMPDSADWAPGVNVDFCWEFVLKADGTYGGNRDLLSQAAGSGAYPYRAYRGSGANAGVGLLSFDSGVTLQTNIGPSGSIVNSAWAHVAIVRQSSTWRIYIDGVQVFTDTNGNYDNALFDASDTLKIGQFNPNNTSGFKGWIQCARYTVGESIYLGGTTFAPPTALFPTS